MKILYFDCFSGAAGDMILGALLDAGASVERVREELAGLPVEGWELEVETVTRGAIRASKARVAIADAGGSKTYLEILRILDSGSLSPAVLERSKAAFGLLGDAEAKAHGVRLDEVHFHEVGAVDALVDIAGSFAALEHFAPDRIVTSPIPTGRGLIASQAGTLPLPAPAVVEILARRGAPVFGRGERELITPTGAAILATVTDEFGDVPAMSLEGAGYGAGDADPEVPNVVRVLVGRALPARSSAAALLVETNLDDMNPELVPPVVEALLAAGAQDAWVTPISMKKGRPAFLLSVLIAPSERDRILDVMYRETTTLGLRITSVEKDELSRRWVEVDVDGRPVRVKLGMRGGDAVTVSPEHEDAVRAARATGLALKEVYARAGAAARSLIR